jgi:hypothetical protein
VRCDREGQCCATTRSRAAPRRWPPWGQALSMRWRHGVGVRCVRLTVMVHTVSKEGVKVLRVWVFGCGLGHDGFGARGWSGLADTHSSSTSRARGMGAAQHASGHTPPAKRRSSGKLICAGCVQRLPRAGCVSRIIEMRHCSRTAAHVPTTSLSAPSSNRTRSKTDSRPCHVLRPPRGSTSSYTTRKATRVWPSDVSSRCVSATWPSSQPSSPQSTATREPTRAAVGKLASGSPGAIGGGGGGC